MVWLSLFLTIALLAMSTAYSWVRYDSLRSDTSAGGSIFDVNPITQNLNSYLELRDTWLVFFIISAVLLGVILLVTLFLRNRIRLARNQDQVLQDLNATVCLVVTLLIL